MRRSILLLLVLLVAGVGASTPARVLADRVQCDAGSMGPDVYRACLALQAAQNQQAQNAALQQRIQNEVASLELRMAENATLIQNLNAQIAAQQEQIATTGRAVDALDHQIRLTQADVDRQTAHINVREQLLSRRVRATDLHGSVNYVELVVTSTNFNQMVDRLIVMQQLIRSDHQLLQDLRDEKARVQTAQAQLATQRKQQADLLDLQQSQAAALEASQRQLQANLAYERLLEQQDSAELARLAAQRASIDAQVASDQAAYDAAAAAAGGGSGNFGWPEAYGSFYLTQPFGCSPYPFEPYDPNCPSKHFHSGLDMAAPYGADVRAADTGIVHLFSSSYGYGNYIVMINGNGYSTLYGHLAGFNVANGATVARGAVIGFEGSTGNSTGAHLHFEIRVNNVPQNPCAYLNPGC